MHYDKPDRLLLGEQKKRTTEILNEIRSVAKKKSVDDFADFVAQNQNEFSYSPQVGQYCKAAKNRSTFSPMILRPKPSRMIPT